MSNKFTMNNNINWIIHSLFNWSLDHNQFVYIPGHLVLYGESLTQPKSADRPDHAGWPMWGLPKSPRPVTNDRPRREELAFTTVFSKPGQAQNSTEWSTTRMISGKVNFQDNLQDDPQHISAGKPPYTPNPNSHTHHGPETPKSPNSPHTGPKKEVRWANPWGQATLGQDSDLLLMPLIPYV